MAKKKKADEQAPIAENLEEVKSSEMISEEIQVGESWIEEPKNDDLQSHNKFSKFKKGE